MSDTPEKKEEEHKYIELNSFLKVKLITPTGGKAKLLIRSGAVKVNDTVETRNGRKLHAGDIVTYDEKKYTVEEKMLR